MTSPLRRMTFQQRLLVLLIGGLGLTLLLSFFIALIYARSTLRQSLLKDLRAQVQVLSGAVAVDLDFGMALTGSKSISAFMTNPEIVAVKIVDKDGRTFAEEARPGSRVVFGQDSLGLEGYAFSDNYLDFASEIQHEGQKKGTVYLRASLSDIQKQFRKAIWALAIQGAALLLILFLIGSRVLRGISKPILEMASTARRVSTSEDYSLRMAQSQEGEIGVLAHSFNDMLERIEVQDRRLLDQIRLLDEDLEARRRIEAELRVSEQRLALALESAGEGVWDWLVPEGIIRHNDRWCRILALDEACLEHSRDEFLAMVYEEDRNAVQERLGVCLKEGGKYQSLHRMRRGDGSLIWVESRGQIVERDASGKPRRMVGRMLDVTELQVAEGRRKELEFQLQHLQRMESVGRLAGGVAHDMNNVLGAIMMLTSFLEDRHQSDPQTLKDLRTLQGAADRGRNLVKNLMDFARKDLQEAIPLDLNEVVRKEADLLRSTTMKRVAVELDLQDPLPLVMGEASAMSNILMNLCVNAMDAMPKGGRLCLRTRVPSPGLAELVVEDSGEGMTPEVRQRALEPFFTTKAAGKGTGLGLSIVFGTVKAHGGTLDILSEPGKGTQIRIQFPVVQEAQLPAPSVEQPPWAQEGPLNVLLVDDDPLIQETVPRMLTGLGHRVEVAKGGFEGLERLKTGPAPHLVVLDMNMPGITGQETLRRLRLIHPTLPVIFGSGFMDLEVQKALLALPHVQLVPKPYTRDELRAAIRAAMIPAGGN
jgi:PAS domain S-box-containing protein